MAAEKKNAVNLGSRNRRLQTKIPVVSDCIDP